MDATSTFVCRYISVIPPLAATVDSAGFTYGAGNRLGRRRVKPSSCARTTV